MTLWKGLFMVIVQVSWEMELFDSVVLFLECSWNGRIHGRDSVGRNQMAAVAVSLDRAFQVGSIMLGRLFEIANSLSCDNVGGCKITVLNCMPLCATWQRTSITDGKLYDCTRKWFLVYLAKPNWGYSNYLLLSVSAPHCSGQSFNADALYVHIHPPYIHIQLLGIYGIYTNVGGHICFWHIFGNNRWSRSCSGLYFGMQNIVLKWTFSILAVWTVFGMWQPYLFSNICQICSQCPLLSGLWHWLHTWHMYVQTVTDLVIY